MIISPYARWYAVASEPLITEDANTVAHVWWPNGALSDTKGNVWTQNGTVPQVPRIMRTPAGAGPFSDANYYSLGTGSDVLDFTGDFSCCAVSMVSSLPATNTIILGNGLAATAGYVLQFGASGVARLGTYAPASSQTADSVNAAIVNEISVACFGRAGTTSNVKLNLGAFATAASAVITTGVSYSAKVGRYENAGLAFGGTLYELWFSTTTPSDALFTAIMQNVKGKLGITAW